MLRLRIDNDGTGGWALTVPEPRSVNAGDCLHAVDALSEEALIEARSRLEPGRRSDAQRAMGRLHRPAGVDHPSPGRRRGVVADPARRPQHRVGTTPQRPTRRTARGGELVRSGGHRCSPNTPSRRRSVEQADTWRQVTATPAALAAGPTRDRYLCQRRAPDGIAGCRNHPPADRRSSRGVPRRHPRHPADRLRIGLDRIPRRGPHIDRHRRRGPRPPRGPGRRHRPVAHRGLVHHQIPGGADRRRTALGTSAGRRRRTGTDCQARQGTTARPARSPDLRSAALPQHRCRSKRARPDNRIQLPRTTQCGGQPADISDDLWRISQDGLSVTDAAAAVPMPLSHTAELNAATIDTDTGPHLHATWTWAPSALDQAQISRLSQLWFDALAGICAHVATTAAAA